MKTAPAAKFTPTFSSEPLALSDEVILVHPEKQEESRLTLAAALLPFTNSLHCKVSVQILRLPDRVPLADFGNGKLSAHAEILAVVPGVERYLATFSRQMFHVGVRFAQDKAQGAAEAGRAAA